ncbi:MAG: signal recognition particle receptor subunit alpha, partial [Chitinophagales bacterium]
MGIFDIFKKEQKEDLNKGLEKTKQGIFSRITKAIAGKNTVDDEFLDELENILISSDVGVETTLKIIDRLGKRVAKEKYFGSDELNKILKEEIVALLSENNTPDFKDFSLPDNIKPYIVLIVGVNGVGKTTTIGKLAYQYKEAGKKVLLGAADT